MNFFKLNPAICFIFSACFAFGQTHSPIGIPGPDYWQNQADYNITAELDTTRHTVTGLVRITYTNKSPYNLDFLWLQLDQNKYKKESRGTYVNSGGGRHDGNGADTERCG